MLELNLFCKKAFSKKKIESVIFRHNFQTVESPDSYYWFEEKDHKSMNGCSLKVYKGAKLRNLFSNLPRNTKLAFAAETYGMRSYEDVEMQNNIIKELKKEFGGSIFDPQEGKRQYLTEIPIKLSREEKLMGLVFLHFKQSVTSSTLLTRSLDEKTKELFKTFAMPAHIMATVIHGNNLIVPHLVACLEGFLKSFFIEYIDSDPIAKSKMLESKEKISFAEGEQLISEKKRLAELLAETISFQNLEKANKNYLAYLDIDLKKIWHKKKKIGKTTVMVWDELSKIIELRHQLIHGHRPGFSPMREDLDKNEINELIKLMEVALNLFAENLETHKRLRIDLEKYI